MTHRALRKIGATVVCLLLFASMGASAAKYRTITLADYRDKLMGGWVGQMAGVAYGDVTEFRFNGRIIPENEVPGWTPEAINRTCGQDDVYVEIPFLLAMNDKGVNCGWEVFGNYFRDTEFDLWHANRAGRDNLRKGIPAPDSGHYSRNTHCDDIDWQIEADMMGMLAPGLSMPAIDLAWRAGHVMNYGDGVYGGVAVAAMHSAAFFAVSVDEIIEAGRRSVPVGTEYRRVIDDVLAWKKQGKTWEANWKLLEDKWGDKDRCPSGGRKGRPFNIDASLNGAYVFMGLAYGGGDFEKSMRIAMRCGQDSDCNPSTVGSILGNWIGYARLPDEWKSGLDRRPKFSYTDLTFDGVIDMSVNLAREVVKMVGGTVSGSGDSEVWKLPVTGTVPPIFEQWPEQPNTPPHLTARAAEQTGRTVTFTAEAVDVDGIRDYQWFFGDLSYATGRQVTHTYRAPGVYEAICYAADRVGNTSWRVVEVSVP